MIVTDSQSSIAGCHKGCNAESESESLWPLALAEYLKVKDLLQVSGQT